MSVMAFHFGYLQNDISILRYGISSVNTKQKNLEHSSVFLTLGSVCMTNNQMIQCPHFRCFRGFVLSLSSSANGTGIKGKGVKIIDQESVDVRKKVEVYIYV